MTIEKYVIESQGSTPSFKEFQPVIPYQKDVIRLINHDYDYRDGALEILLSGSVGSAKSLLMAHLAIMHCCKYPKAMVMLGRKSLTDLKDTIYAKILEHMEGTFVERKHFWKSDNRGSIKWVNGSRIISRSWSDRKFKKMRSLELSAAVFEELTENDLKDMQAYIETTMRVGRLPHIHENFIISATNPDSPSHWVYNRFMEQAKKNRRVFYSITKDNPFLPRQYIESLEDTLDPKMALRMLEGKWIELTKDVIYYSYDRSNNYCDKTYKIDLNHPVIITWDFNIGHGKPLSCALIQFINDEFHIFNEVVVEGISTLNSCETLADKGFLHHKTKYYLCGDASGKHRDTRSNRSDWDIINKYFSDFRFKDESGTERKIEFEMKVPLSNPPIRERHNLINSYCHSASGKHRLMIYKEAVTCEKGLRLAKLKEGAYIEDDSDRFQHITTAIGYAIFYLVKRKEKQKQGTIQL
jgi:PBSX family phage terminase large subunit